MDILTGGTIAILERFALTPKHVRVSGMLTRRALSLSEVGYHCHEAKTAVRFASSHTLFALLGLYAGL
jgi:hypothetical protein